MVTQWQSLQCSKVQKAATTSDAVHVAQRIRLDRASEAQPRSEPFVGRARPLRADWRSQKIYLEVLPDLKLRRRDCERGCACCAPRLRDQAVREPGNHPLQACVTLSLWALISRDLPRAVTVTWSAGCLERPPDPAWAMETKAAPAFSRSSSPPRSRDTGSVAVPFVVAAGSA